MKAAWTVCLLIAALAAAMFSRPSAQAAQLTCAGILGNSGEQGATLVRFGEFDGCRGLGVVYDREGSLWDRGGDGVLNRYALDGRLLASYRIPRGKGSYDQLTRVGQQLVLLVARNLYTLPLAAEPNTAARPLGIPAECISFNTTGGRFAAYHEGEITMVDPVSGKATPVASMDAVWQLEIGPDDALYAAQIQRGKGDLVQKLVGGKPQSGDWPKRLPGERMQFFRDCWFAHSWAGTIRRFDRELSPAPGVVMGGASGAFIGHLDQNPEVDNGRGLARINEHLYAVSGLYGILHLLDWDQSKQQFRVVRRIGAAPLAGGIGLDRSGNVWWYAGRWRWDDGPDAPLDLGIGPPIRRNTPALPGVGQIVMLDNDRMVAAADRGKPAFLRGPLTEEICVSEQVSTPCGLKQDSVAAVVYHDHNKLILLCVTASGEGAAFAIGSDGSYRGEEGEVALRASPAAVRWTTLAMKAPDTLLGAADGKVIELMRDGKDWREIRRWNAPQDRPAEQFGDTIYLAADAGRLWISDRQRHRVLVLDMATDKLLAAFGHPEAGDDIDHLSLPQVIAARGDRAIVHDAGNQRLVKLRFAALVGTAPP